MGGEKEVAELLGICTWEKQRARWLGEQPTLEVYVVSYLFGERCHENEDLYVEVKSV